MSPARFKYDTEFTALTYYVPERDWLLFEHEQQTATSRVASFLVDTERLARLQTPRAGGWEMLSVSGRHSEVLRKKLGTRLSGRDGSGHSAGSSIWVYAQASTLRPM